MFRRSNTSYVEAFEKVCGTDAAESAPEARKMVMFRTQGMCYASLFVDTATGECLPLKQICENSMKVVLKSKDFKWKKPITVDEFAAKMVAAELKAKSKKDGMIQKRIRKGAVAGFDKIGGSIASVRANIFMDIDPPALWFFDWEGKPRDREDMIWAVSYYESKAIVRTLMTMALVSVIGGLAAGATFVAAEKWAESRKSSNNATASQRYKRLFDDRL